MSSSAGNRPSRAGDPLARVAAPTVAAVTAIIAVGMSVVVLSANMKVAVLLTAALASVIVLARPQLATLLFAGAIYTNAAVVMIRFHGVPQAAAASIALLLGIPLAHQVLFHKARLVVAPAAPLFFVFLIVQTLEVMTQAEHPNLGLKALITTLSEGLVLYLLVTNVIRTPETLRQVVWTLLAAGAFLGVLSVHQQLTGRFSQNYGGFAQTPNTKLMARGVAKDKESTRAAGPIGEKNYFAQFMLTLIPLGVGRLQDERAVTFRGAALAACLLVAGTVAFTASRGAAVGFVVLLAAMLAMRVIRWRHAFLAMLAAGLLLLATPALYERLVTLLDLADVISGDLQVRAIDKSTQGRLTELLAGWLVFCEHPVLGVGPGNFPAHFVDKADALGFQVHGDERMAHCTYLQMAAEYGLTGLSIFLGIVAITIRDLQRARRHSSSPELRQLATSLLLSLIVMLTTSFFLSFAYERYYWLVLAMAGAVPCIERELPRHER